ncbi:MAG: gamma-glutamyltransferase, partial [Leptolyngbyaceae cyanobacterium SM1_3_5]|nr:gamma-glutamyltransferase [Leptolyngbyaceae cyanobacterium SM1_3_5]
MGKTKGSIAGGHPKTVEAGVEMFRLGGNVFDAAVAAVLASCVVEPTLTSLGGGGFMLAHTSDNQNILFDFFTQTPRQKKDPEELEFYPAYVNFGSVTQEFFIGLGSVGVPGTFGGLYYVHQRLGRLPFQVVCEPAIDYAKQSIELAPLSSALPQNSGPIL